MNEHTHIDRVSFFDALATKMNGRPEIFEVLGDVDMEIAVIMRDPQGDFRVCLSFADISCSGVREIGDGDEYTADCWLEGPLDAWRAMFDDIVANGHATGRQTLNSLTLLGDHINVRGEDPMGVDKFFRFNQTVQAFFDGAALLAQAPAST